MKLSMTPSHLTSLLKWNNLPSPKPLLQWVHVNGELTGLFCDILSLWAHWASHALWIATVFPEGHSQCHPSERAAGSCTWNWAWKECLSRIREEYSLSLWTLLTMSGLPKAQTHLGILRDDREEAALQLGRKVSLKEFYFISLTRLSSCLLCFTFLLLP